MRGRANVDLVNLGEFSMEYKIHAPVLPNIQRDMIEAYRKKQLSK